MCAIENHLRDGESCMSELLKILHQALCHRDMTSNISFGWPGPSMSWAPFTTASSLCRRVAVVTGPPPCCSPACLQTSFCGCSRSWSPRLTLELILPTFLSPQYQILHRVGPHLSLGVLSCKVGISCRYTKEGLESVLHIGGDVSVRSKSSGDRPRTQLPLYHLLVHNRAIDYTDDSPMMGIWVPWLTSLAASFPDSTSLSENGFPLDTATNRLPPSPGKPCIHPSPRFGAMAAGLSPAPWESRWHFLLLSQMGQAPAQCYH